MTTITRRQAFTLAAGAPFIIGAHKKATAFALIGDRYHNSDYIRIGLGRTIMKESGISIDFCDETKMLNADTLLGYKMLIIQRDGMLWPDGYADERSNAAWLGYGSPKLVSVPPVPPTAAKPAMWMTDAQGMAVKQFVRNGGSALFLHNVTHVGLSNKYFREVLGASYTGHPPIRQYKVKVINPNHPIARGVKDFIVTDEQHYMDYDRDRKEIFLESVNEEGLDYNRQGAKAPAGWSHTIGKGRVCYMSPGHLLTALWNPEYIKLQKNAIQWLTRKI